MQTIPISINTGNQTVSMHIEEIRAINAVSPTVDVERIDKGVEITVHDLRGTQTVELYDGGRGAQGEQGATGTPGQDGISPTVTVAQTISGATITVSDATGITTAKITNGQDGAPGQNGAPGAPGADGISPTVTVIDITGGHRITIVDATGVHSFDVMDGQSGPPGSSYVLTEEDKIEIADAVQAASHTVRYDDAQILTASQQNTARGNIEAASISSITELEGQINDIYDGKLLNEVNKLDPTEIKNGVKLSRTGEEETNAGFCSTGFIKLDTTKSYVVYTGLNTEGTARTRLQISPIVFYNNDKNPVSSRDTVIAGDLTRIPTNAVYVRLSVMNDNMTGRQPMVEFIDSASEISSVYVPYDNRSHGLNYLDKTQQAILARLDDIEERLDRIYEASN